MVLSRNQKVLLGHILRGHSYREISEIMNISPAAAKERSRLLLGKTKSKTKAEMIFKVGSGLINIGGDLQ